MDGILSVYKEQGYTSFDVVAKLRGILKQKKIGHTGTLDPMAEGVLIVCLGKATKLVDMLTMDSKEYRTVMLLGKTTDTDDVTGQVLSEKDITVSEEEVNEAVISFIGKYNQIPPMYSAIKINGKKLYEYARAGIEIERKERPVEIFSISNITINIPYVSFDVKCSKGTYIRSLCRDIGDKLGCGATMSALVRNRVHDFEADDALKLDQIKELTDKNELNNHILPIDSLLKQYRIAKIKDDAKSYLRNGNKLNVNQLLLDDFCLDHIEKNCDEELTIRVYADDEFLALYRYEKNDHIFKPYKMFL